ncbi:hypothetical protein HDU84_001020, partial [Entophlyctis sp. JEL0112]
MSEAVLAALEAVSEHPFNYDAHAACIKTLREAQSVDELQAAGESMHSLLPLSQDLWIEWLDDELASFNATDATHHFVPSAELQSLIFSIKRFKTIC